MLQKWTLKTPETNEQIMPSPAQEASLSDRAQRGALRVCFVLGIFRLSLLASLSLTYRKFILFENIQQALLSNIL